MSGEPCAFSNNLDYSANTYKTIHGVPDINACCRLCKEDSTCVRFIYETEDKNNNNRRECFLKTEEASKEATSPNDMYDCSCEKGMMYYSLDILYPKLISNQCTRC